MCARAWQVAYCDECPPRFVRGCPFRLKRERGQPTGQRKPGPPSSLSRPPPPPPPSTPSASAVSAAARHHQRTPPGRHDRCHAAVLR
eukprot:1889027-Prymnesium_polylepis.2